MDDSPLWISMKIAVTATVVTFFLGVLAAWAISSMRRGKYLADGILSLPLVLPPTVTGFFLLLLFGKNSVIGKLLLSIGIRVVFTWQGGVIAAIVISFPVMYRTARGAMEQVDRNLLDAARTLGMGEWRIFWNILIPEAWPGIAAAVVLAFARALGEFGATMMIAGNLPGKTQTMSVAVYTAMQSGNRKLAFCWVAVILSISLFILVLMNYCSDVSRKRTKQVRKAG